MTTSGSAPVVLLVVPPGTVRPEPLAAAVRAVHPDWVVTAVWAGDPQLRPTLDGDVSWHSRVERGTAVLLTQADERVDWWFASRAVSRLLDDGAPAVVVLRVGVAAVLGSLDDFVAPALSAGGVGSVVELVAGQLPDDERWPQEEHLLANGSVSAAVAVFGAAAGPAVRWITDQMADRSGRDIPVGRVFERAATLFGLHRLRGDELLGSAFGWEVDEPSVLDLTGFSASSPWSLRADLACELRVEVATRSARRSAVERALPQIAGARAPVCLPGGWSIDEVVRAAVCSADAGGTTPDPWSSTLAFRSWIAPLFWTALHARRADLSASFPDPFGHDGDRFALWRRRAAIDDGASLVAPPEIADVQRWQRTARRVDGVDLVGYHRHESSLGDVARRISAALGAANITHGDLANLRTGSPLLTGPPVTSSLEFASALAVVNADQFPALAMDHPELFAADTHLIGYWFWELEHVPVPMRQAASMVDEIWVGSQFVADAFRAAVDTPVRHVPIPVAAPVVADRDRASFPLLAPLGDRFVFAVVFDHFSVTERKNPVGVIEAFRRAFSPDEGPVLVVKSMNASKRWPQHQQVVAAAGDRPDIILWDEHLERADHMAFIAAVDCLVALHRSEGLGLHLAEAMWLGTPVIATRYSGNLDLMDDDCSILIDATLVHVERGEGVYPAAARWADPDLDQAAAAMRFLVADPARRGALAAAGRVRMERQPTLADTGRLIAGLLGIEVAS